VLQIPREFALCIVVAFHFKFWSLILIDVLPVISTSRLETPYWASS